MAEGKKSFIVYTDWLKYTDLMTIEQKGLWIDWCLQYCNDLNPELPNDSMVKMLCVMCKDILKRDLKKYEEKRERFKKIGKQFNNDTENDTENGNRNREPKTECVNSNMLIVNSNKYISNDILEKNIKKEKEQIKTLTDFLEELQELFGMLAPKYNDLAVKMYNDLGYQKAIYEIKSNLDQPNPINTTYLKLYNNKVESSGSEWLDKIKKGL